VVPARNPRTSLPGSTVPIGGAVAGTASSLEDFDDEDDEDQPSFT